MQVCLTLLCSLSVVHVMKSIFHLHLLHYIYTADLYLIVFFVRMKLQWVKNVTAYCWAIL